MKSYESMNKDWPSDLVARSEIALFTGGAIKPGTLANLDSMGRGPHGRFRLGRKIVYSKAELVRWLKERSVPCDTRTKGAEDE